MRIGIVGSGIAGLAAAYMLEKQQHQVTIFERQSALGMDAHSVELNIDNNIVRADVPSRMFSRNRWPNLTRLYEEIGVEFESVDTTQTFSYIDQKPFLKLTLPYKVHQQFASLTHSTGRRVLGEIRRLMNEGEKHLANGIDHELTLHEYLRRYEYAPEFIDGFLYPALASTVCTCSYQALDNYPASIILETLEKLTGDIPLQKTKFGTQDVVQRLSKNMDDIRLETEVTLAVEMESQVRIDSKSANGEKSSDCFDHLLVATQANHVANIVPDLSPIEKSTLGSFKYDQISIVVHTDESVLRANEKSRGTFNFISDSENRKSVCNVLLNRFHSNWSTTTPVIQSIGELAEPAADSIIKSLVLQRPVVDQNSFQAWQQLEKFNSEPNRKVWFCGSYASHGIPLLESGVVSGQGIVERLLKRVAV